MSLISVHNLGKTYDNEGVKTNALHDVTFTIDKGEFISIMGPSGSGKSTLMHVLGLLDRATGGEYLLDGKDVSKFSDDELARLRNKKIGFVFQAFNLLPKTSVFENVELPLLYDDYPIENNAHKVTGALAAVDMSHRADYLSNQLSGGEKQRVAIARALVNDPEIIFADEPTGNLDSQSGLQVMAILQKLNASGRTIVLVTHETYTAEHAKRVLMMKDGQIVGDQQITNHRRATDENFLK
jgi:putative ABC transport system ATP-binding protein